MPMFVDHVTDRDWPGPALRVYASPGSVQDGLCLVFIPYLVFRGHWLLFLIVSGGPGNFR